VHVVSDLGKIHYHYFVLSRNYQQTFVVEGLVLTLKVYSVLSRNYQQTFVVRNTISVPPPTDSNPISDNVRNNDPPYTDRNGYDPRTLQNDNPPNREMNLPNNRSVGNIPTGNGGKYKGV
jgi:hypothetical protein